LLLYIYSKLLQWVASFDGPSAFLATLLMLHFCCVLVKCFCYMENKLSLSLSLSLYTKLGAQCDKLATVELS